MADEVRGRTVLVAGLGVSGVAAARALVRAGARVRAIDSQDGDVLRDRASALRRAGVDVDLGVGFSDGSDGLVAGVDLLVPSPGLPEHSPLVAAAVARGLPVWSEPELAWRLGGGRTRLVGVTGTNGKTTTTELLGALLDAPAGGNIGTPLVELLTSLSPPPVVVAELSSFQLRFTESLHVHVAVLLNIAPDHLDWHGDLGRYEDAKARLWANSGPDDWLVVGDDEGARAAVARRPTAARTLSASRSSPRAGEVGVADGWVVADLPQLRGRVAPLSALGLRGEHNVANACAAVAAAAAAGADPGSLAAGLARYSPGPHRLALVAERDGTRWVDDSKATNPHAAAAAITACASDGPLVWIAGGLAKGVPLATLEPAVRAHVRHVVTIGTSGPEIADLARGWGVEVTEAGDLGRAVRVAADLAAGVGRVGTVLLAPACASMDQFRDYKERGRAFASAVGDLPDEGAGTLPAPLRRDDAEGSRGPGGGA